MSNQLTPTDLMHQAMLTSQSYLNSAVLFIDEKFGEGYAKAHPELIVGYMGSAAQDYNTGTMHQGLGNLSNDLDRLASAAEELANGQSSIDSTDITNLCEQMSRSSCDVLEGLTRISGSVDNFLAPVEEIVTFMPRGKK